MHHQLNVRRERPGDERFVAEVLASSFQTKAESRLVDRLRRQGVLHLSLVACFQEALVGTAAFTRVTVMSAPHLRALGLGPVGVLPAFQNRGAGTAMIRRGIAISRGQDFQKMFVLGHTDYYARFGFQPAFELGYSYPDPSLNPWFQVLTLRPEDVDHVPGVVGYHHLFDEV